MCDYFISVTITAFCACRRFSNVKVVRQGDGEFFRMGNAVRNGHLRFFANAFDGLRRMNGNRSVSAAAADGNGINRGAETLGLLAYAQIARHQQHRHIVQRGGKRVDPEIP